MRLSSLLTISLFSVFTVVSCTRQVKTETVKLVIPFNKIHGSATQAAGDLLRHAIINIRVGSQLPLVHEFDFKSNPIPWGSPVTLEIPNVPKGTGVLIQYLGLYETVAGASYLLYYGDNKDKLADIGGGTTTVNIVATPLGTANREGQIAGRVYNGGTAPNLTGPTGTLVGRITPPNGSPPMNVLKSSMVAGYFSAMVLDTIPITYFVVESGEELFVNVTLASPQFATSVTVVKFDHPTLYRREKRDWGIEIRSRIAGELILGHFRKPGFIEALTPKQVCYVGDKTEAILGWYRTNSSGHLNDPLIYSSGGGATNLRLVGGGTGSVFANLAIGAACTTAHDLVFYQSRAFYGEEGFAGMRPPFKIKNPYSVHGGYVHRSYNGSQTVLEWKYLAGAEPGSAIDGVDILGLQSSGSFGGSNDSCNDYLSRGYAVIGSTTGNSFNHAVAPTGFSSWSYAVCAYKNTALGKKYVGMPVEANCMGDCGDFDHAGWGTNNGTPTAGPITTQLFGAHAQVINILPGVPTPDLTTVSLSASSTYPFSAASHINGEVMLNVIGQQASGQCGNFNGSPISVGQKAFTRILNYTGASFTIVIPKGTFADSLNSANLGIDPNTGNAFCYVQAVSVPHFMNLTIGSALTIPQFNYDGTGGGVGAFRVNNILTINGLASVDADGVGHLKGASGQYGEGSKGKYGGATYIGGSGGDSQNGGSGGGGGAVGDGGQGVDSAMFYFPGGQAAIGGGFGSSAFALGGGGGSPTGFPYGGNGGGMIFVVAKDVVLNANFLLTASGQNQVGPAGGAGGGGTVAFIAQKVSGPFNVGLESSGGNGDSSGTTNIGGSGGGGLVFELICNKLSVTNVNVSPGIGATAGGNGQHITPSLVNGWNPLCNL